MNKERVIQSLKRNGIHIKFHPEDREIVTGLEVDISKHIGIKLWGMIDFLNVPVWFMEGKNMVGSYIKGAKAS